MDKKIERIFQVEGALTTSSSYCGGADIGDEVYEYQKQRPFRTTIYIRRGTENNEKSKIIDSVSTDAEGKFSLKLKSGNYILISTNQKSEKTVEELLKMNSEYTTVNEDCLRNWWKSGLFKIEVKDTNISGLNHNFHQECFIPFAIPCIGYNGPYPP